MHTQAPNINGVFESFRIPPSWIYRSSSRLLHRREIIPHSIICSTSSLGPSPRPFRRILITSNRRITFDVLATSSNRNNDLTSGQFSPASGGDLVKNTTLIGLATIASKIMGLLREIIIASSFGVGPVATAFKYASVLPGFAASLLGGANGPIHITMATVLSKLPKDRQRKLFHQTNTIMFLVGSIVAALVFIFADQIIHIYAPGLRIMGEGQTTREIAIKQLRIMIPCIVLSGPVGLGFGYMSAEGNNIISSISPALSSLLLIALCVFNTLMGTSSALFSGGILLSCGASLGIFLQWVIQVIVLWDRWYCIVPDPWVNIFKSRDVCEFFSLLVPATISLGLRQIASFTDLCFASLVPGAAADAYLLVMAPVGLLSSVVVLPLLPAFSKMVKTASWQSLVETLKRAVLLSLVVILTISSVTCVLAEPIITLFFERHAFDSSATALVSSLFLLCTKQGVVVFMILLFCTAMVIHIESGRPTTLACCLLIPHAFLGEMVIPSDSLGSPFFILRELLVSVFYALGDGKAPFLVSAGSLALNAILDWLFVSKYYLGAEGLVLSTSFTTALSVIVLSYLLQRRLAGLLDFAELVCPILLLTFCCIISSFTTFISYKMVCEMFASNFMKRFFCIKELLSISFAGALGISSFFLSIVLLQLSGLELAWDFSRTLMN